MLHEVSRQDAERLLGKYNSGAYLVRRSVRRPGAYVCSVHSRPHFYHYIILHHPTLGYYFECDVALGYHSCPLELVHFLSINRHNYRNTICQYFCFLIPPEPMVKAKKTLSLSTPIPQRNANIPTQYGNMPNIRYSSPSPQEVPTIYGILPTCTDNPLLSQLQSPLPIGSLWIEVPSIVVTLTFITLGAGECGGVFKVDMYEDCVLMGSSTPSAPQEGVVFGVNSQGHKTISLSTSHSNSVSFVVSVEAGEEKGNLKECFLLLSGDGKHYGGFPILSHLKNDGSLLVLQHIANTDYITTHFPHFTPTPSKVSESVNSEE